MFVVDIRSADSLVKSARIEYEHGMRQAVQHLAALGHQRIAFMSGPEHLKTAIQRKGEFLMHERNWFALIQTVADRRRSHNGGRDESNVQFWPICKIGLQL
jgi:DNA-binding LacI/PurR family transcriptional regulator